jgi:transposase
MVAEVQGDYPSQWAAIGAVAQRLGIGSTETLRKWARRAEVDAGTWPGLTSEERGRRRPIRGKVPL